MRKVLKAAISGGLLLLGMMGSAFGDTFTFNFNTLSASANNAAVQTWMNNKLGAAGHVTVTGAKAGKNYTGDGHVVGPCAPSGSRFTRIFCSP